MTTITVRQLIDAGACKPEVNIFRWRYGDSVEVTEEAAAAVANDFDWDWAAKNFLTLDAYPKYHRVSEHAWEEHRRGDRSSWPEFQRVRATCFARLYMDTWPSGDHDRIVEIIPEPKA